MSLFSNLFSGGSAKAPEPVIYQGFRIFADPVSEAGGYRLAARIEKEVGGETRSHQVIRADVFKDQDEARTYSLAKAKQIIDERGDGLFG